MEINENSWHYRLIRFSNPRQARDFRDYGGTLCGYFWTVVWNLLVCAAKVMALCLLSWVFIYQPISYLWAPDDDKLVLVFIWAAALAVVTVVAGFLYIKSKWGHLFKKSTKKKEPSILVEYIRAKKQRFCPIIKIVKKKETEEK